MAKQNVRNEIQQDLLDQLERNGTVGKYYIDLIKDYMDMWDTKNLLTADIKERGVNTMYNNGGGQTGYKKNDCIDQTLKVNGQMLKLLDSLGIKPLRQDSDSNADEEM